MIGQCAIVVLVQHDGNATCMAAITNHWILHHHAPNAVQILAMPSRSEGGLMSTRNLSNFSSFFLVPFIFYLPERLMKDIWQTVNSKYFPRAPCSLRCVPPNISV